MGWMDGQMDRRMDGRMGVGGWWISLSFFFAHTPPFDTDALPPLSSPPLSNRSKVSWCEQSCSARCTSERRRWAEWGLATVCSLGTTALPARTTSSVGSWDSTSRAWEPRCVVTRESWQSLRQTHRRQRRRAQGRKREREQRPASQQGGNCKLLSDDNMWRAKNACFVFEAATLSRKNNRHATERKKPSNQNNERRKRRDSVRCSGIMRSPPTTSGPRVYPRSPCCSIALHNNQQPHLLLDRTTQQPATEPQVAGPRMMYVCMCCLAPPHTVTADTPIANRQTACQKECVGKLFTRHDGQYCTQQPSTAVTCHDKKHYVNES